jgi:hypothetical protein
VQQRYYGSGCADRTSRNRAPRGDFLAGDVHHPGRTAPVDMGQLVCHHITL